MWYFIFKKIWKPKKLTLNKILRSCKWKKNKIKNIIDTKSFLALIKKYVKLDNRNDWVVRLIKLYTNYCSRSKLNVKKKYTDYSTILLLKLTKKQLFTNVMKLNKMIAFKSNGIFLKKLNIEEKSKKKDIKLYIINLKKTEEFLRKNKIKNILINLVCCNAVSFRLTKSIRNIYKNYNYNYIFSPKIPFSFKKFKKIKSIKRKLRKIYTLV